MRTIFFIIIIALISYTGYAQSFFTPSPYANSPKGVGANSIFGWGENFDRSIDIRPSPHPDYGTMMINYHTGLTFSAHTAYGGIRFYNQGYPSAYSSANGSKMVMSITDGYVGIGTTNPVNKLQVNSDNTGTGAGNWIAGNFGGTAGDRIVIGLLYGVATIGSHNNALNGWSNLAINTDGGNVSIGTTDAKGYKLAVNGSAIAESMTVKLHANWPDYVFKKDYKLPSLTSVKTFIEKNQHLPEMPSETDVAKNGINLGEIVKIQTKKIEELTLYLIEKNKQIENQQATNKSLQDQINKLSKQIAKK